MKTPNDISRFGYIVRTPKPHQLAQWDLYESHYAMVALCQKGFCEMEANMERVMFRAGMRLCLSHVMLLRCLSVSDDFEAIVMLIDRRAVPEAILGINSAMLQKLFMPIAAPIGNENDFTLLVRMISTLQRFTEIEQFESQSQVGLEMLRSFFQVLAGINLRMQGKNEWGNPSSSDHYFRQFLDLLAENVQKHHDVAYYSEQLCITPKYLNLICKRCAGRKAKEVINILLLILLKHEILSSERSLKEIAEMYSFCDQSSLGKFCRNYLGVSPMTLRQYGVQVLKESMIL